MALQAFTVRPGRKSRSKDSQGKIKNKLFSLLATISQTTSRHFEKVVTGALHTVFVRFASFLCSFFVVWIEKATNEGVETAYPTADDTGSQRIRLNDYETHGRAA